MSALFTLFSVIVGIAIIARVVQVRDRSRLWVSLSASLSLLENLSKILLIIMSLDKPIFIGTSVLFAVNAISGVRAVGLFSRYSGLNYAEWVEFNVSVKTATKYEKVFINFAHSVWWLGPHSTRLLSSSFAPITST